MDDTFFSTPSEISALLEGANRTERIVAVEPSGLDAMSLYIRNITGHTERRGLPFQPWLLAANPEPWLTLRPRPEIDELAGDHPLKYLVRFPTFSAYSEAARAGRETRETFFDVSSSVDQFLMQSGCTLFKGMQFAELRRLQLDIETLGLDASQPDAAVVLVALSVNGDSAFVIDGRQGERAVLSELNEVVQQIDPDVIEGHNIFNFDLPFLARRAERHNVPLLWGRDHSAVRFGQRPQRFKSGALSHPFNAAYVHGRHIVDTYQQIQRYDIGGRLESYGLKPAVEALGLTRGDREFVPGDQIKSVWQDNPERLIAYALDDARDVDTLSRLALPTEFYQSWLLPRSLQSVATAGPGSKINDLMVRAYLAAGHSVPLPRRAEDYPGGHAELLATGVFAPVVKCDAESLYPSIMLAEGINSASDTLNSALPMLAELTRRRLVAKARVRTTTGEERAMWDGLQSSFKVLINSFYGYLGFGAGLFNDFEAAGRVTLAGQHVIRRTVDELRKAGAIPIEVDTDGVYFVPPPGHTGLDHELELIAQIGQALPAGVKLAHDGRYRAMLSLQLKNYALLHEDGTLTMKGSALRSRRLEPIFRRFLADSARSFMAGDRDAVREDYFTVAQTIKRKQVAIGDVSQWAMINDDTLKKQPRLSRLLARMPGEIRGGERIQMYERDDGELGSVDEYAHDENSGYLLKRLHETAGRFRPLFASEAEFTGFFPPLSARTNLDMARNQQSSTQLDLF